MQRPRAQTRPGPRAVPPPGWMSLRVDSSFCWLFVTSLFNKRAELSLESSNNFSKFCISSFFIIISGPQQSPLSVTPAPNRTRPIFLERLQRNLKFYLLGLVLLISAICSLMESLIAENLVICFPFFSLWNVDMLPLTSTQKIIFTSSPSVTTGLAWVLVSLSNVN